MRKRHLLKKLNNKGETMILVIVAMSVILIMGASILYATYTAYMIRNTERKSEDVFSSADTGMDLIKNRLGEAESLAAETGYSKLLNIYSGVSSADQKQFIKSFQAGLGNVCVNADGKMSGDSQSGYINIFPNGVGSYNVNALEYLLHGRQQADDDEFKLSGTGAVSKADDGSVLLKDLTLIYLRKKDGYKTSVTTDIRLKVPDVSFVTPGSGTSENLLEKFTCIADKGLYLYDQTEKQINPDGTETVANSGLDKGGARLGGSIYAGEVHVVTQKLTVNSDHRVIIGRSRAMTEDEDGNVSVDPSGDRSSGELIIDNIQNRTGGGVDVKTGGTLWTQDINLVNGGSLTSENGSDIYVADDLAFGKGGGHATLSGTYVGFGNKDQSGNSSSIIFNQKVNNGATPSKLDITNLQSLILAGRTFVMEKNDTSDANNGAQVGMGSSITAKPEQLAYLIPSGNNSVLGDIPNPRVISNTGDDKQTAVSELEQRIAAHKDDKVNNMSRPLSAYDIGDGDSIEVLSYPSTDKQTVTQYYFFKFNSAANANAYFKDYFENNKQQINDYLKQYSEIKGLDSSKTMTAATGLTGSEDDFTASDEESDTSNLKKITDKYQERYDNLSQTLNEKASNNWQSTPFYTLINTDQLHKMCGNTRSNRVYVAAWWGDKNDYSVYNKNGDYVSDDMSPMRYNDKLLLVVGKKYFYKDGAIEEITSDGPDHGAKAPAGYIAWPEKNQYIDFTNQTKLYNDRGEAITNNTGGSNDDDFMIVDGDVRLGKGFNGIVMSSGTVTAAEGYINLVDTGAKALVKTKVFKHSESGSGLGNDEDWSLTDMVRYENWRKNG